MAGHAMLPHAMARQTGKEALFQSMAGTPVPALCQTAFTEYGPTQGSGAGNGIRA